MGCCRAVGQVEEQSAGQQVVLRLASSLQVPRGRGRKQFHGEGELTEMEIETERVHTFKGNFINGFRHGAGVVENYEGKTKKGTWIQGTYYDFKDDEPIYFGDRKHKDSFVDSNFIRLFLGEVMSFLAFIILDIRITR